MFGSKSSDQIKRIKRTYLTLLELTETYKGDFAQDAEGKAVFNPMEDIAKELRTGGIANSANFGRNKDFFTGIERGDKNCMDKMFKQLGKVPHVGLAEVERILADHLFNAAKLIKEYADKATKGRVPRPVKSDV